MAVAWTSHFWLSIVSVNTGLLHSSSMRCRDVVTGNNFRDLSSSQTTHNEKGYGVISSLGVVDGLRDMPPEGPGSQFHPSVR